MTKPFLQIAATLLLAVVVLPAFASFDKDEKADAPKADPAKKDDKDPKADPAKKDDKADPAKKDDKADAAKKDAKDPKADAAKKDDKADAAKKDAKGNDAAKKDDKKSDGKKDKKDEHVNSDKSMKAGSVTGKIVTIEGTKRTLRLSVAYTIQVPDLGASNAVANFKAAAASYVLQAQQANAQYSQAVAQAQQALAKKDKNGYQSNMNQAQQYQAQAQQYQALAAQQNMLATRQQTALFRNETKHQDIEISTTDDVTVRNSNPPEAFDEKGKARRLTSKELKEARGSDTRLPGYQADFSNLREEQIVTVTLVKNKDKDKDQSKPKSNSKKDKDADALLGDNLPKASLILIVAEPPATK